MNKNNSPIDNAGYVVAGYAQAICRIPPLADGWMNPFEFFILALLDGRVNIFYTK